MPAPRLHAIFHRQVSGDHALLRLAQRRFRAAGLGAEFYPPSPDGLREELPFCPTEPEGYTVHLPRDVRVLDPRGRDRVAAFASAFPRAYGLIVHDQPEVETHFDEYLAAVRDLDARLRADGPGPWLFVEYAAGIEPRRFAALFETARGCARVSACIDISHIGIRQCQRAYERLHPGEDVCRLKPGHPGLPARAEDVQAACATALPTVCETVVAVAAVGKPVHFHLHDGHPSSTFSAFGVSDHLSFFHEISVHFSFRGSRTLPLLFGPLGLKRVIDVARRALSDDRLSFTLEVHPPDGRLGLGEYAELFSHWRNKENAERMNHWVEVLLRNHRLLREACGGPVA